MMSEGTKQISGEFSTFVPFGHALAQWLLAHQGKVCLQIPPEILDPVIARAKASAPPPPGLDASNSSFMSFGEVNGKLVLFFDQQVNAVALDEDTVRLIVQSYLQMRERPRN
ncbi:MAG: hypothetical protein AB1705_15405 [Verrucomicrobiota bacterium]